MKITDLGEAIKPGFPQHIVGIRPGEKLHEQMIGEDDAVSTYEYNEHFKILPVINNWADDPERIKDGIKVEDGFAYNSGDNSEWMSIDKAREWLKNNKDNLGKI